jgi:hypothetical protein
LEAWGKPSGHPMTNRGGDRNSLGVRLSQTHLSTFLSFRGPHLNEERLAEMDVVKGAFVYAGFGQELFQLINPYIN